jgi:hypothetical protein
MNCSQLLERRMTTNWEKPVSQNRDQEEGSHVHSSEPQPQESVWRSSFAPSEWNFVGKPAFTLR